MQWALPGMDVPTVVLQKDLLLGLTEGGIPSRQALPGAGVPTERFPRRTGFLARHRNHDLQRAGIMTAR